MKKELLPRQEKIQRQQKVYRFIVILTLPGGAKKSKKFTLKVGAVQFQQFGEEPEEGSAF